MKDWRKMLEGIGGYDNELIGVPSGGVKEMVDDIEYLQRQLANAIKQNVLLKEAVDFINGRISFSSEEFFRTWSETVGKALDATADLSGLVVCDAEPVGHFAQEYMGGPVIYVQVNHGNKDDFGVIPLYEAKEKS